MPRGVAGEKIRRVPENDASRQSDAVQAAYQNVQAAPEIVSGDGRQWSAEQAREVSFEVS